jgi:hypothetical protein
MFTEGAGCCGRAAAVELRPVPNYTEYRYAAVNDRRVIVEPRTRKIIKIID